MLPLIEDAEELTLERWQTLCPELRPRRSAKPPPDPPDPLPPPFEPPPDVNMRLFGFVVLLVLGPAMFALIVSLIRLMREAP